MSTSNPVNLFETATRAKLRFQSLKGEITVEHLWDVPLRSRDGFDLDAIAKAAHKALRTLSEESFVETKKTAAQARAEVALDVVKHVIEVKLEEEASAKERAGRKEEKEKLLKILAEKQDGRLSDLTEKELQRRIKALDAET